MPKTMIRLFLALPIVAALAACDAIRLNGLNDDFVAYSAESVEFNRQLGKGDLSQTEFDSLISQTRMKFAENGDKALEYARETDSLANRVSFLGVAMRNYLSSGPIAETKVPDLAEQGIELCQRDELKGENAQPVTCGYFHIGPHQAVANEAKRELDQLVQKAERDRVPGGPRPLTAEDGERLHRAFLQFIAQIQAIDEAMLEIDIENAGPDFEMAISRQKIRIFCNAHTALFRFPDVVDSGANWDQVERENESKSALARMQEVLGIESPHATCDQQRL